MSMIEWDLHDGNGRRPANDSRVSELAPGHFNIAFKMPGMVPIDALDRAELWIDGVKARQIVGKDSSGAVIYASGIGGSLTVEVLL